MTVTVTFDKPLAGLHVGETALATIKINGLPMTSGTVDWAMDQNGIVSCKPVTPVVPGQVAAITALASGKVDLYCIANHQLSSLIVANIIPAVVLTPRIRDWIQVWLTDFYYTWTTVLENEAAVYYDGFISGDIPRHERMKKLNPMLLFMPYTVEYAPIISGNNLQSQYLYILGAWATQNKLSIADVEAMFLKGADGQRLVIEIWGSKRNVGDPTNPNWMKFQVWRYQQIVAQSPAISGAFVDEFGSNQINGNFKLGAGGSATRLGAIIDAQTVLIGMIAGAIGPKKLIVNTAAYIFQNDADIAHAAKGVHLEQINNPMSLDWWNSSWPYMDRLVASGILTNIVCAYGFGEYESTKDSFGNHMDTHRGKLLELAAYYMIVTDPALLAIHLENGWGVPPMTNKLKELEANIGRFTGTRTKIGTYFIRNFQRGLVVVNPIVDRNPPNYEVMSVINLPTDRKYAQIMPDGSLGPQVKQLTLRRPEAAILKVIP